MLLLTVIASGFYLLVSWLIWLQATESRSTKKTGAGILQLLVIMVIGLHGLILYRTGYVHGSVNLALGNIVSLVAWISVVLLLLTSLVKQSINLGLVVMPLGLFGLLIGVALPGKAFFLENLPHDIGRHIIIAIPAYGVLSIAFAQALILWMQEKQLRKPRPGNFLLALPAIETMETNLFHLNLLGFVLLTINLITGMHNTLQNYGSLLPFNHHILLALIAWSGFGGLLLGHTIFGWRGQVTAKWTITAFVILGLAYFGTRFVNSVILGRL